MSDSPKLARLLSEQPGLDPALYCHGQNDGECVWPSCPQIKDSEPAHSGRSCPLIWPEDALGL